MGETSAGLVQRCKDKLGTPYVYGAKGEILTSTILGRPTWENPDTYTSAYKAKAAGYMGQRCTDCSGLTSWYAGHIRDNCNYHDMTVERVDTDHLNESMTGWMLQRPGHIRVYIGDGYCVEVKGVNCGTIKPRVAVIP